MKAETRTRLYAIDNLRVMLTALVVTHHVALTYGNIPLWYYVEPAKDPTGIVLDVLVVADQAFFMGFFFLLSGFFTPGSHDRKGARLFVRDRLVRLGIPLLVYLLLLRPLAGIGGVLGRGDTPFWEYYLLSWDPGPMWFVEVLLVLALAYTGWRALRAPLDQRPATLTARSVVVFTVALAAVTFLWRLLVPTGTYWPVIGLPTPSFLPQYVAMFVLGCVAFRRGWFETLPARAAGLGFGLAAVATPVLLVPSLFTTGALSGALTAAWESAFAVGMIIGFTVWFRERHNTQGPRGRFLAEHAFTVYIIHPLVLVGLGFALSGLQTIAIVKFAAMLVLALPLCWWLAYLVRSLPGAKRVL
ncbi:acyltransferase family protein [Nonomuraea sp. PA05]|uniref:acyltransferase family protein n=1 Tax=Nonomuraea sp. PA05 TaxID=2604466 RepID=UPI0021CC9CB0|nr:acyltransferase [Nonomuraea sp. PA05]